ncbi:MAG: S1 family peptidase [Myxococcales bacterium]|nr:S1 family peptidase [Myxococcales bacterium]
MVHVVRDVTNDERARCSAVMLTTSAVLTAGHCGFEPASPATLTVRSGTPGSTVDSVTARKSIVHPTYIGAEDGTDKLAVRELGIDLAVILPDVPFFNLPAQPLGVSAPPASTLLQTPARIVGRMLSGTSGTDDFGVYFMDAPILEIQTVVRAAWVST